MASGKAKWINGLDRIRFVLALIVLLSHVHDPFTDVLKDARNPIAHLSGMVIEHLFSGAAAVSGFFIISGFVIHYPNADTAQLDVIPFLIRRLVRIVIPMLVIGLVADHYSLFYVLPLWSLYCELAYYIMYPLLFKIKWSWHTKLYLSYVVSICFVILLLAVNSGRFSGLNFNGRRGLSWQISIIFINLPAWILGVILAEKIDSIKSTVTYGRLWLMRGGAQLLAMISVALRMHYHINYTYSLIIFSLFFYKWLEAEIIYHRNHPAGKWSEYLGKFSYSLYLCHLLCLAFIIKNISLTTSTYLLYLMLPILISYVAYLLVERPAHKLARYLAGKISE